MRKVWLFVLLALTLAACGPGKDAVKGGAVTDYITNTEPRNNGKYVVWVMTDMESLYCTDNLAFYNKAQELRKAHELATIFYDQINIGDPDGDPAFGYNYNSCDTDDKGSHFFRIKNIVAAKDEIQPWVTPVKQSAAAIILLLIPLLLMHRRRHRR